MKPPPDWRRLERRVAMPAVAKQLLVRALLDDAAAVEHHQPVHARRWSESRCAIAITRLACHQSCRGARLDRRFDLAVERRGIRLVEHQDRRVVRRITRAMAMALTLAARQIRAAFADLRVVAAPVPFQSTRSSDELVRVRRAWRRRSPPRRCCWAAHSGCCRRSSDAAARYPGSPWKSARAGFPGSRRRCPVRRSGCGRPRGRRTAAKD